MVTAPKRATTAAAAALALGCALVLAGCELLAVTPFPDFLGYTDISRDLSSEIKRVWDNWGEIEYQLAVVYTGSDAARVLLVVEPPSDQGGSFSYSGRLFMLDEDLNAIATISPVSDLDFFGRPFAYGHDGVLLVSNMLITAAGQIFDNSLPYLGLEGPAIADTAGTSTYVFSPPPGAFATFDIRWQRYFGPSDTSSNPDTIWSLPGTGSLEIIPPAARPGGSEDAGYQILDAVYDAATGEVTFLLSEPSQARVLAARTTLAAVVAGTAGPLAADGSSFPIEVSADRPLDARADAGGFFLRRRDGLLERYNWTASGSLSLVGDRKTLVGDRYFFRHYGFLSGASPSSREYMYRFDPSSRILTRYKRWW